MQQVSSDTESFAKKAHRIQSTPRPPASISSDVVFTTGGLDWITGGGRVRSRLAGIAEMSAENSAAFFERRKSSIASLLQRSHPCAPTMPASISGKSSSPLLQRTTFAAFLRKVSAQFAGHASTRCNLPQFYIPPTRFVMNGVRSRREVVTLCMSPLVQ
jgi:hypothetical protein